MAIWTPRRIHIALQQSLPTHPSCGDWEKPRRCRQPRHHLRRSIWAAQYSGTFKAAPQM